MYLSISDREIATVLAALRHWQRTVIDPKFTEMPEYGYFYQEPPLDADQIDELCERLNTKGPHGENPPSPAETIKAIVPILAKVPAGAGEELRAELFERVADILRDHGWIDRDTDILNPVTGLTHRRQPDGSIETAEDVKARLAEEAEIDSYNWLPRKATTPASTIQRELLTADVFPPELTGYAASAAAGELVHHWRSCRPPLDTATMLGDIDGVIALLQRWRHDVYKEQGGVNHAADATDAGNAGQGIHSRLGHVGQR